ncbi:MAG TPA: hypothetical protein PKZ42_01680 [Syntrophales bacterium]|nr:hypothetical protein [Syntrophales bacterium]
MRLTFYGTINNGKLTLDNRNIFEMYLGSSKGRVKITLEQFKKVRSTGKDGERNMNGYYWLYLNVISQETGDHPNNLHEYFKRKLLPPSIVIILAREVKLPATTTKLSGNEMWDYMVKIEELTGIPIPPHPDELS